MEIGTCGIHTAHCAFKHGGVASGWDIDKVLSAMYKIFKHSSSKRDYYEWLTEGVYLVEFCSHWWAKNDKVAVREITVWEMSGSLLISGWPYQNPSNLLRKIKAIFV